MAKREVTVTYQVTISVDIDAWLLRTEPEDRTVLPAEYFGHDLTQAQIANGILAWDRMGHAFRPVVTVTRVK